MKTFNLFAYTALAAFTLSAAACSDDDPAPKGQDVLRGEKCRIETFVLNLGEGETLSGDVYDYDKSIDLQYLASQLEAMQSATATVTLSEGATISPDPSSPLDYTQSVSFTVTGADQKTTRVYKTKPVKKEQKTYTKVSPATRKTAAEMLVAEHNVYKQIGASGDKIVIGTKVFDGKTLAPVGDLNMTGYESLKVAGLANDEVGHLVASLTANGDSGATPVTYACWKKGWNQPAETIIESKSAIAAFISVGGNLLKGKALVSAVGGRLPNGPQFCWGFTNGTRDAYHGMSSGLPSNDGSWTQMISPCSGEIAGTWFIWDSVAGGSNVLTWSGFGGSGTPQNMIQIPGNAPGGPHNWGNYTKGSIRSFTFDEKPYAAVFTTGWPCTYVSIVDPQGGFLLDPNEAIISAAISDANAYCPVGTYVYNEKDKCGYVYVLVPGHAVWSWKLEVAYE